MTCPHTYLIGNDHCLRCYERQDPIDVKLDRLQQMVEEAQAVARTILQEIEDEADDRLTRAEWDADRGA